MIKNVNIKFHKIFNNVILNKAVISENQATYTKFFQVKFSMCQFSRFAKDIAIKLYVYIYISKFMIEQSNAQNEKFCFKSK